MSEEQFGINYEGRLIALAKKRGDRIYVTAVYGPKAGQSLGVISGEDAAIGLVRNYMKGLS